MAGAIDLLRAMPDKPICRRDVQKKNNGLRKKGGRLLTPFRVPSDDGDGEMSFRHNCTEVKDIEIAEPMRAQITAIVQKIASERPLRSAKLTAA